MLWSNRRNQKQAEAQRKQVEAALEADLKVIDRESEDLRRQRTMILLAQEQNFVALLRKHFPKVEELEKKQESSSTLLLTLRPR